MKEKNHESKAQKLIDRILKNSTLKQAALLSESDILKDIPAIKTRVPMLNLALNGRLQGGLERGITMLCGESKSFKTSFSLEMVASFLEEKPNGICLFFDNEFGAKKAYFESFGVDTNRTIHLPFEDIEELKFEMIKQLDTCELEDDIIIFCDSLGATSSRKELESSREEKVVTDMTRAKSLKSLFRMITPKLYLKNIPMIIVNHIYFSQSFISTPIVGGGSGGIYSSTNIWIIGKNKLKEKEQHTGYKFIIRINKSRDIKEGSCFPITVRWENGIAKWSGFDEIASQFGIIEKCKIGRSTAYQYKKIDGEVIQVLESKVDIDDDFWNTVLKETDLEYRMENMYLVGKQSKDKLIFDTEDIDAVESKIKESDKEDEE